MCWSKKPGALMRRRNPKPVKAEHQLQLGRALELDSTEPGSAQLESAGSSDINTLLWALGIILGLIATMIAWVRSALGGKADREEVKDHINRLCEQNDKTSTAIETLRKEAREDRKEIMANVNKLGDDTSHQLEKIEENLRQELRQIASHMRWGHSSTERKDE